MADALAASGTEMVTVALRRVDLDAPVNSITDFIDQSKYLILPNTSGAADAQEAVRLARLARAAGKQQERQGAKAHGAPAAWTQLLEGGTPVPGSLALGGCGGAP